MDVSHIRQDAEQYEGKYAILGGDWSPFFHDAVDLLGMDVLFLKMYDEPELVDAVLQHLVDFYAAVSQRIFDAAASSPRHFLYRKRFRHPARPGDEPQSLPAFHVSPPRAAWPDWGTPTD